MGVEKSASMIWFLPRSICMARSTSLSAQKRNRSYLMQVLLNRAGSASAFVLGRLFFGCFPFRKELRAKIGLFLVKLIELAVLSLAGISHLRLVFKIQR